MAIEIGKPAVIRSTQEEVFVVDIVKSPSLFKHMGYQPEELCGHAALVRRPQMNWANGITSLTHVIEEFLLEELESPDDRDSREIAAKVSFQKKLGKAATGLMEAETVGTKTEVVN